MNPKNYVQECLVTEARDMSPVLERLQDVGTVRLLHSMIGLCTEAGEFQDALKKHIFYGKEIDKTNLKEELGDLCWYISIALDELGFSYEEIMETNIAKLKARYGEKFTENAALNRDLDNEGKILAGE